MSDKRFYWSSWFQRAPFRTRTANKPDSERRDVPWLHLSTMGEASRTVGADAGAAAPIHRSQNEPAISASSARWLGGLTRASSVGVHAGGTGSFSDRAPGSVAEDDGPSWPREGRRQVWQREPDTAATGRAGSTWTLQVVLALALAGLGVYVHTHSSPWARTVNGVYQHALTTDDTAVVWPRVQSWLHQHHLAIPAVLGTSQALRFQMPMQGPILSDYSPTHPRVIIQGSPGAAVHAAGSGTVRQVAKLSDGYMVVVDHGAVGESQYFDLANVSVAQGEQVEGGEVIGRLAQKGTPSLQFDMVKGGQYVNPHDYIVFGSAGGTA